MAEYRVVWQREGQARKRTLYQTRAGAITCAERQVSAAEEMTWLAEPLPPIVFGPVIEEREVGPWTKSSVATNREEVVGSRG